MVSDLNKNNGGSSDLAKKKGTDRQSCIPLLTPSCKKEQSIASYSAISSVVNFSGDSADLKTVFFHLRVKKRRIGWTMSGGMSAIRRVRS